MKKVVIVTSVLLAIILLVYILNNKPIGDRVIGKYDYINYKVATMPPNKPDVLVLFNDSTYKSKYYGSGTFSVSNSLQGSRIYFDSEIPSDVFGYSYIKKGASGQVRIHMSSQEECYYEKVE